jgi:tRNA A37 threonylcarbamoyladenosine dehydratase
VVDCIDDISTKADLLLACKARGIQVVSAMGAGGKADPTRILVCHLTFPISPLGVFLKTPALV